MFGIDSGNGYVYGEDPTVEKQNSECWRLEQLEARLNEFSGNGTAPSGASPNNL